MQIGDPLADKYYFLSPYSYCADNPIKYIDPNGKEIRLTFDSDAAREAYLNKVNEAFGGNTKISFNTIQDGKGYTNQVVLVSSGVTGPITDEQQAFSDAYSAAISDNSIVRQNIVQSDNGANVGDWVTGKVDMLDVAEFDKAGKGGASSAGALIHETVEQLEKAKIGLSPGQLGATKVDPITGQKTYVDYESAHAKAINAENKINGNTRIEDKINGNDTFIESDKTKTSQIVTPNTTTGVVTVTKTKIP